MVEAIKFTVIGAPCRSEEPDHRHHSCCARAASTTRLRRRAQSAMHARVQPATERRLAHCSLIQEIYFRPRRFSLRPAGRC